MEHCAIEQDWKNLLKIMGGIIVISFKYINLLENFFVDLKQ